jgi:hypothetical protein
MNQVVLFGDVPGVKAFKISAVIGESFREMAWVYEPGPDDSWHEVPLIVTGSGILPETCLRGFLNQDMSRFAIHTIECWRMWLQADSEYTPSPQLIENVLSLGRIIEIKIRLARRLRNSYID